MIFFILYRAETSLVNGVMTSFPSHLAPNFLTYALQHLDIGSSQYVDDATLQVGKLTNRLPRWPNGYEHTSCAGGRRFEF